MRLVLILSLCSFSVAWGQGPAAVRPTGAAAPQASAPAAGKSTQFKIQVVKSASTGVQAIVGDSGANGTNTITSPAGLAAQKAGGQQVPGLPGTQSGPRQVAPPQNPAAQNNPASSIPPLSLPPGGLGSGASSPSSTGSSFTPSSASDSASPRMPATGFNPSISNGQWYDSGPDSMCQGGKNSFQTKTGGNGLDTGDLSLCDVIYNTITQDSCTAAFADQLGKQEPSDMEEFCPGFSTVKDNREKRAMVLMNLIAAVVKTESGWKNNSTGDGGKSRGLLQLTASSDSAHGCSCKNLHNEFNATQNLQCGTHMIVSFMARDHTVGRGSGEHCGGDASGCGAQGIARSFGPFRDGTKERADIIRRVSGWCRSSLGTAAPPAAEANGEPPAANGKAHAGK
jgi:hypothetical protein